MSDPTSDDLRKHLDAHGYGFQYAALRRAEELAKGGHSKWVFDAAEFPVGDGQNMTHIDLILRQRNVYLVGECKRVDPARGNWCFVKAPYTRRNADLQDVLVFEKVSFRHSHVLLILA